MNKKIRTFIAIPFPGYIKKELEKIQNECKKTGIRASWPKPSNIHLTLKFIGDIPIKNISKFEKVLSNAVKSIRPFTLFASGIGAFPSLKRPKVLWAGVKGDIDVLAELELNLSEALKKEIGLAKDKKKFTPHLTIGRIKHFPNANLYNFLKQHQKYRSDTFEVSKIYFYKSTLLSSGAKHEILFSIFLNQELRRNHSH